MTGAARQMSRQAGPPALTGLRGDARYFGFAEFSAPDSAAVARVLRGQLLGAVFRGVLPAASCAAIARQFWASPAGLHRGGEAPVRYLGAYHYHKTTREYLSESEAVAAAVDEALAAGDDPVTHFYRELGETLAPDGVSVRRARHEGRQACKGVLRSWFGRGQFALVPHEDRGQCGEPRQAGFEIQRARDYCICALNICLENGDGGRLRVWNIQPDEQTRRRLGTFYSGSPYPVRELADVESITLDIRPGDTYVFNGSHVHAVEPSTEPGSRRTTVSGLFAFIDEATVVSWT